MDVVLRHAIEYEADEAVSVDDLVLSLEANARLLRRAGDFLSTVVPGVTIEHKKVSILHISQESPLKELFAYSIIFTYQDELEKEVPQLIEILTGRAVPDQYDTVVTVVVMLIAVYGISTAFSKLFPDRQKPALDEAKASLIERLAKMTGVAAQRIAVSVEVLFTGRSRRPMLAASQNVFAPTRGQRSATVRAGDGETLVSRDAVKEAQAAAGLPVEEEEETDLATTSEYHHNVQVVLHAMDRDRKRFGWAGHVPSLFDDRIPMHLEKNLKPETIFGKNEIMGDILLTSEEDENGDMKPKEFLLIHAYM
jgi:hypothetical protein